MPATAAGAVPTITTFAGRADPYADQPDGDGGPATEANIVLPQDVAVDAAGNVYIADYFGEQVRMVDLDGTIHTVAGNPEGASPEDGALATEVRLGGARGVAIGDDGNLFIATGTNVFRVRPDGRISFIPPSPTSTTGHTTSRLAPMAASTSPILTTTES